MLVLSLMALLLGGEARAQARPLTPTFAGNCQAPAWAPNASRLTFEVNDHDARKVDLYVIPISGGTPTLVRPPTAVGSGRTAGFAGTGGRTAVGEVAWGPPMLGRFVYSASAGTGNFEIFVEGSTQPLGGSADADGDPTWSADSYSIAFTSGRSGQGDLYLVDLRAITAPPKRLTSASDAAELDARFAPQGRTLVYVAHREGDDRLMILDDVDKALPPRALTPAGGSHTRPSWSPDGTLVAFYIHADPAGRVDLAVVPRGGGAPRTLLQGVVPNARGPSWTPDSRTIIAVKDDDQRLDPVMAVRVDGAAPPRALNTGTVGNADTDVVGAADGKVWLAVAAQGLSTDPVRDFRRIFVLPLAGL